MNVTRLSKLSDLVTNDLKRKPTIVVEPKHEHSFRMFGIANDVNINIDADEWILPDNLKLFIAELARSEGSNEEKILKIYQKLCEDYTYDDNVLSYIKKNDDDTFFLPDSYGRDTDSAWRANRQQHNRRNCFEISRILAKSISEMLRLSGCSSKYDVCILWDEAVTHYLVGLASDEYCVSLDLDDFTQIKDLTRMKTGLTLEGIKPLYDPYDKFSSVVRQFNSGRSKIAREHIEEAQKSNDSISTDDMEFLQYAIQILRDEYDLDSAGMFEYIKEIVDTKIGARSRKKVWKEVENNPGVGTRYTRCLVVTIDDISYIIDVTKENASEIFRRFSEDELSKPNSTIISFKQMDRNWKDDPYDGR